MGGYNEMLICEGKIGDYVVLIGEEVILGGK